MKTLTIGQLARQAGIGVETVRFYEHQGLLKQPQRRPSGYRQYDEQAVSVLLFIRRAKSLGFTLKEIKGLLDLRIDAYSTRSDVRQVAMAKVADIETKIADLRRIRQLLKTLIRKCHGDELTTDCPILEALRGGRSSQSLKKGMP
jgi:Cu(I)-responsive transcriptional regulator